MIQTENYFSIWLCAATESARDWWESCKRASAERRARGGPTLEEMWAKYQADAARYGFEPVVLDSETDALIDAINEEVVARSAFAEVLDLELDRMLYNKAVDCAGELRRLAPVSLN